MYNPFLTWYNTIRKTSSLLSENERRAMVTVTKQDLIALGYGSSFAADIIRQAKTRMVEKGYPFYASRKLDRVPVGAVEELLGFAMSDFATDGTPQKGVKTNGKRPNKESR